MILRDVAVVWRDEVGVVRQRRVAANTGDVLHPALGSETVVVPSDRIEDVLAAHPMEAGDGVGVGVAEHVADVQRTTGSWRRRVDREDLGAARGAIEAVGAVGLPPLHPASLDAVERRLLGDLRRVSAMVRQGYRPPGAGRSVNSTPMCLHSMIMCAHGCRCT